MKKEIQWGSPKEYQVKERKVRDDIIYEDTNCSCTCAFCTPGGTDEFCIHYADDQPKKRPRRSLYCKRLKGPHDFISHKMHEWSYVSQLLGKPESRRKIIHRSEILKCTACGKERYKSLPDKEESLDK